jgi:cellulose synthase/poly-beta-1,6-N-acetylglucosamine synthase-like glycosyltransferase
VAIALTILATLVAIPLAMLTLECLASLRWPVPHKAATVGRAPDPRADSANENGLPPNEPRPPVAALWSATIIPPRIDVLVPAHNEAETLPLTLPCVLDQLGPHDRLWLVADNCTDETAEVARSQGATVLVRNNPNARGKGYALDFGRRAIAEAPGDVVVVLDADCTAAPGAIRRIAVEAAARDQPVQGNYLMDTPAAPTPRDCVSQAAVVLKNLIRPLGLRRLGLPCLLTGTGMAFPWDTFRRMHLATGHIVEDMQVSIELVLSGAPPRFCPDAQFVARLPGQRTAATSQRTRWEHGHLLVLLTQVPRLLGSALNTGRLDHLLAALDLAIPPLSLLGIGWFVATILAMVSGLLGLGWTPAAILVCAGTMSLLSVLASLTQHLPGKMSWQLLTAMPQYALAKLPIYLAFPLKRQATWVRTARD